MRTFSSEFQNLWKVMQARYAESLKISQEKDELTNKEGWIEQKKIKDLIKKSELPLISRSIKEVEWIISTIQNYMKRIRYSLKVNKIHPRKDYFIRLFKAFEILKFFLQKLNADLEKVKKHLREETKAIKKDQEEYKRLYLKELDLADKISAHIHGYLMDEIVGLGLKNKISVHIRNTSITVNEPKKGETHTLIAACTCFLILISVFIQFRVRSVEAVRSQEIVAINETTQSATIVVLDNNLQLTIEENISAAGNADEVMNAAIAVDIDKAIKTPPVHSYSEQQIFDISLKILADLEGGHSNHANDPGKETMAGVTQATYDSWRRSNHQQTQNVTNITKEEIQGIYLEWYWKRADTQKIAHPGLQIVHFSAAVNVGPKRAERLLQSALNRLGYKVSVDGAIGPQTLGALKRCLNERNPRDMINAYFTEQQLYYQKIIERNHKLSVFRKGWMNRIEKTRKAVIELKMYNQ